MALPKRSSHRFANIAAIFIAGFFVAALVSNAKDSLAQTDKSKTGKQLYQDACATCHGVDGKGSPQHHVGFELPLPDFSDCNFASREPSSDWIAIAHEGGPIRGFSEIMPSFGEAFSMEELRLIDAHVRTFCGDSDWPSGDLNLPKPLVTEKAYPEDEAIYSLGITAEKQGEVSNKLVYEKRFGARNQIEFTIPFGWKEQAAATPTPQAGNWLGGLGDIAIGAKRALHHSSRTGTIFSVTGEIVLPTGDSEKGLGKGTTIFEPFAAFSQVLPSEFFIHSQAGFEFPFDKDRAQNEGFWRFVLGRTFTSGTFGRAWSPMCEFLGAKELVEDESAQWDLVPQIQVTLNRRQHIMVNLGVRLPLTERGTRDTQLLFYLLWDWFDGGFFTGW